MWALVLAPETSIPTTAMHVDPHTVAVQIPSNTPLGAVTIRVCNHRDEWADRPNVLIQN